MSRKSKKNEHQSLRIQRRRLLNDSTDFFIKEEYNTLRTNIMFSSMGSGCKVIGFVSANEVEGKSLTCSNLGISLGKNGENVLIVDGDLRAPKQAKMLEIDGSEGLSNLLVSKVKLSDTIKMTNYKNVDLMPSGTKPPNPSEMLGSDAMKNLTEYLRGYYDYILMDLPPINIVTDAAVVSKHLNGLVLVVRDGVTRKEDLLQSIQRMQNANSKIIGIVLNDKKLTNVGYGKKGKANKYSKYANE